MWEPQPRTGGAPGSPCANGAPGRECCDRTGRGTRAGTGEGGTRTSPLPPPLAATGSGTTLCDTVPPVLVKKSHRPMRSGVWMGEGLPPFPSTPRMGWSGLLSQPPDTQVANPLPSRATIPHLPGPSRTRSCGGGAGTGPGEVVDAGQIVDVGELPDDPQSEDAGFALPQNSLLFPAAPGPASSLRSALGRQGQAAPHFYAVSPSDQELHSCPLFPRSWGQVVVIRSP